MSHLKAAVPAQKEGDRGRVGFSKVQRYRAGKALDGAFESEASTSAADGKDVFAKRDAVAKRTPIEPAVIVKKSDSRLARLAQINVDEARGEGRQRHRRELQEAQVIRRGNAGTEQPASNPPAAPSSATPVEAAAARESEGGVDAMRRARRERALQMQKEQEQQKAQESSSEYETDEESEYTSDSSDEEHGKLAKPVFVAKSDRETVMEKERIELEEQRMREEEKVRQEARKAETKAFVSELVDLEKAKAASKADTHLPTVSDVDTDTDSEDEEEFEAWKRRELHRIKREQALREVPAKDDLYGPKDAAAQAKAARNKLKFLQKYYHKGAFYQTEADDDRGTAGGDAIYQRDFTGATGEDKFNKEALPSVMQVRNFGRAGRTKWKHLAAEDTTMLATDARPPGAAWQSGPPAESSQANPFMEIRARMEARGAASKNDSSAFEKPTRRKR